MTDRIVGVVNSGAHAVGFVSRGAVSGSSIVPSQTPTTADLNDILQGKTAYEHDGTSLSLVQGTMPDKTNVDEIVVDSRTSYLERGYYKRILISIDDESFANLQPQNIRRGKVILGVIGTFEGGGQDFSSTTATRSDILEGRTAYLSDGDSIGKYEGLMANWGDGSVVFEDLDEEYSIAPGYYTGGTITMSPTESSKIVPGNIRAGVEIFGQVGTLEEGGGGGTDISDTTATAETVLDGYIFHLANGSAARGTIPVRSHDTISIWDLNTVTIPSGYYDSDISVGISGDEADKIIPENIASGVTILGVRGSHSGGGDPITPPTPSTYIVSTITKRDTGAKTVTIGAKYKFNSAGYVSDTSEKTAALAGQTQISVNDLLDSSNYITIEENTEGTNYVDVSEYKWAKVNVQGGSSGGGYVGTATAQLSTANSSITFTGLSGNPTAFAIQTTVDLGNTTTPVVASVMYNGTKCTANYYYRTGSGFSSAAALDYTDSVTCAYLNGSLTVTMPISPSIKFGATTYALTYMIAESQGSVESDLKAANDRLEAIL